MTASTPQGTALLTIPEVGEQLRLGKSTVYELIAMGALKAVDVSPTGRRKTRIRRQDLEAFIESRTRDARALRAPRDASQPTG